MICIYHLRSSFVRDNTRKKPVIYTVVKIMIAVNNEDHLLKVISTSLAHFLYYLVV